ncbi:MAG: TonB-dependent receptor [Bacteroidales bacterium]|nr:TonB-dependent receptor [Bacteroidales bacterium]MCF8455897.1 TonB-dependent receptor [Bacteroidales bacterium]
MRTAFNMLFLFSLINGYAENNYTISGYVKDAKTGEELIGATIFIKELSATGTSSNAYGFFSITIPEGSYTIIAQFIGYEPNSIIVELNQNTKLNFILGEKDTQIGEVIIAGDRKDVNITQTQMGIEKLRIKEIKNIPVLFGEKDILKTIQLMPGVKSAGEGNSGFYVRGGAADQNLILLDEATVYNASHLLGFFSVFNSDAIKDVALYKGSQPAEYGGRLSSVLDIKMKDGNDKEFGAEGGIGLIASRLTLEGPILNKKGSFIVSGRRTYADLFLKLSNDSAVNQAKLYFYDLNAKANYRINDKNRIFISGYFGRDVLGFKDKVGVDWGNITGTVRWNHLVNDRIFSNTSIIFSNYDYNIHSDFGSTKGQIISRIQDYNIKQDFQYFKDSKNIFKMGLNSISHTIIPGAITTESDSSISELNLPHKYAWENAAYISHEYKPNNLLSFEYGIRLVSFSSLGPGDYYSYNSSGETVDTTTYASGEFIKTNFNIEPRLAINYIIDEKSSVKAMYGRNTQNLHLISNSTSGNPTDLWIPNSNNVKPEIADQVSLGYFRNFRDNAYEFSSEVYYKFLQNQIDYKDGAELRFNENVESQLLYGSGRAYGIEFSLKKKYGKLNGWIGYTLARTEKKIDEINNGEYYPSKQDRTHDFSAVAMYEFSPKWTFSATWVYYTGNAVTFPSGKYEVAGEVVNYYTERNGYRMPAYHRLDIGASWQLKKTEKFESSWNFSLYNAYGRENAYSITFQQDPDDFTKTQAVQTTLFRWVPSISYNFKF